MVLLYEGKAKQLLETDNPDEVIIYYKDSATAFNGLKKDNIRGKGVVNVKFTKYFFELLQNAGIKTHVIAFINELSLRAVKVQILPVEVVVRNFAAGSICKRFGIEKGTIFFPPLLEFFYKDDSLGDPLITDDHIRAMDLMTENDLETIRNSALKINAILTEHLDRRGITLADFKLEFGRTKDGEIILADEITPDTCRFWMKNSMESLDKDVYREDKGDLITSYNKLAEILGIL